MIGRMVTLQSDPPTVSLLQAENGLDNGATFHILSAEVVAELFNVTPSTSDSSGRNQIQHGDTLYAVVFRRLSR